MKTPVQIAADVIDRIVMRGTIEFMGAHDYSANDPWVAIAVKAIEADRAQLYKRVLTFEPDAIRDHFEADEDDPTKALTDEQLDKIGQAALTDDRLYQAFHAALVTAINDHREDEA